MAIAYNTDVTAITGNLGGAAYPDGITLCQAPSVIAASGTNQGTSTQLGVNGTNPAVNLVTTASGTGVMLPAGQPTAMVTVYSVSAGNALLVYPQVGGTINDGARPMRPYR